MSEPIPKPECGDLWETIEALFLVSEHTYDPDLRAIAKQKLAYFLMTAMVDWGTSREVLELSPKVLILDVLVAALDEIRGLRRGIGGDELRYPGTDEALNRYVEETSHDH